MIEQHNVNSDYSARAQADMDAFRARILGSNEEQQENLVPDNEGPVNPNAFFGRGQGPKKDVAEADEGPVNPNAFFGRGQGPKKDVAEADEGPVNPNAFFGRGQGPDKHIVVNEGDSLQNQAKLAEIEFIESLMEGVMLRMFGACFWDAFPTELTGLCFSLTGQAVKEGQVAMLSPDDPGGNALSSEWGHGGLRVKGTPGYGKGIFARGFTRSSTDVDWWGEDGPTTPDSDDHDNRGDYKTDESGTKAWLPMWDYPRVY